MTNDKKNLRTYAKWGIPLLAAAVLLMVLSFGHGQAGQALAQEPCPDVIPGQFSVDQCARYTYQGTVNVNLLSGESAGTCTITGQGAAALSAPVPEIELHTFSHEGTIDCAFLEGPVQSTLDPGFKSSGFIEEQVNNAGLLLDGQAEAAGTVATSFFDVFFDLGLNIDSPQFGALTTRLAISCIFSPNNATNTSLTGSCSITGNVTDAGGNKFAEVTGGSSTASIVLEERPVGSLGGGGVFPGVPGAGGSSGVDYGIVAGVLAAVTAGALALGGAAWYRRRMAA